MIGATSSHIWDILLVGLGPPYRWERWDGAQGEPDDSGKAKRRAFDMIVRRPEGSITCRGPAQLQSEEFHEALRCLRNRRARA